MPAQPPAGAADSGSLLTVTSAALLRISQLLDDVRGRQDSPVVLRLACQNKDEISFTIASIRRDDILLRHAGRVVLVLDRELAISLRGFTVDLDRERDPNFLIRGPTGSRT